VDLKPVVTCPALQTPYIYTTSYYWAWVPTGPKSPISPMVRSMLFKKSLTDIVQISILIQIKK
jgi:hypothetical protein